MLEATSADICLQILTILLEHMPKDILGKPLEKEPEKFPEEH